MVFYTNRRQHDQVPIAQCLFIEAVVYKAVFSAIGEAAEAHAAIKTTIYKGGSAKQYEGHCERGCERKLYE